MAVVAMAFISCSDDDMPVPAPLPEPDPIIVPTQVLMEQTSGETATVTAFEMSGESGLAIMTSPENPGLPTMAFDDFNEYGNVAFTLILSNGDSFDMKFRVNNGNTVEITAEFPDSVTGEVADYLRTVDGRHLKLAATFFEAEDIWEFRAFVEGDPGTKISFRMQL